jgi:hypothetical protein
MFHRCFPLVFVCSFCHSLFHSRKFGTKFPKNFEKVFNHEWTRRKRTQIGTFRSPRRIRESREIRVYSCLLVIRNSLSLRKNLAKSISKIGR